MSALTLTSVQRDFDEWRSTRTKIGKIPEQLWDKALQLLEYYSVGEVTKALHLSGGQISDRRHQRNNVQPKIPTPLSSTEFVEINTSTPDIIIKLETTAFLFEYVVARSVLSELLFEVWNDYNNRVTQLNVQLLLLELSITNEYECLRESIDSRLFNREHLLLIEPYYCLMNGMPT